MKHKKFSDLMLCGFQKVGGRQHFGAYCPLTDNPAHPSAVCVRGAANLCDFGQADPGASTDHYERDRARVWAFYCAWDVNPHELNDEGMEWEHIYGMAVAAGL